MTLLVSPPERPTPTLYVTLVGFAITSISSIANSSCAPLPAANEPDHLI